MDCGSSVGFPRFPVSQQHPTLAGIARPRIPGTVDAAGRNFQPLLAEFSGAGHYERTPVFRG